MSQVEILPWIHDSAFIQHEELLNYISSLPRGTVVGIEGTQFSSKNALDNPNAMAFDELITTCQRRGLEIQFIDSSALTKKKVRVLNDAEYQKHNFEREKVMAGKVKALSYRTGKKVVVAIGPIHARGLMSILRAGGVRVGINLVPFSDKQSLGMITRYSSRLLLKLLVRSPEKYHTLMQKREEARSKIAKNRLSDAEMREREWTHHLRTMEAKATKKRRVAERLSANKVTLKGRAKGFFYRTRQIFKRRGLPK